MENTKTQQPFNPFAAFPAQDRTKIEIIEAYLRASNAWKEAVTRPTDTTYLQSAFFSFVQWYILVHGYMKARKSEELKAMKEKLKFLPDVAEGKIMITSIIKLNELTEYQLVASEYMYTVGITDILQYHRPDELYIAIGQAER